MAADASSANAQGEPTPRAGRDRGAKGAFGPPPISRLALIGTFLEAQFPDARCSILRFDAHRSELRHVHAARLPSEYATLVDELSSDGSLGPYARAIRERSVTQIEDWRSVDASDRAVARLRDAALAAGIRATWCVPIANEAGSAAGVLAFHHEQPYHPDREQLDAARTAASLTELALVYDVEAALLRESESRSRRLEAFRSSVMNLMELGLAEDTGDTFVRRLVEEAVRVIPGATSGAVLQRVRDGAYRFTAAVGFDLERLRTVRMAPEAVAFGHGAYDDRPRVVRRPKLSEALDPMDALTLSEEGRLGEIRAVLSLPIVVRGERIAYLTLDAYDDEDTFDQDAIEMARIFASQAASLMQRFELEATLTRQVYQDELTELPNRTAFKERLQQRLDAGRTYAGHSVLFVDLDDLKPINDSLGHLAGDAVLLEVAERLKRSVKLEDGVVARMGGDEFTILLSGPHIRDDAAQTAQRVIASLQAPIRYQGYDVRIGASIGISSFPEDGRTVPDLLRHADIAMYHAKQTGKGTYRFFLDEMEAGARERVLLEGAMREGLVRNEFEVHFQPRIELVSGHIVSAEALVRWRHPTRGMVSPGRFVWLAEATNLIHPLGRRVLELACAEAVGWPAIAGRPAPNVSVNLSRHQLQRADIVDEVATILTASGLPPERLEVEVLESSAMSDVSESARTLARLREMGITVALDDFGTGHSSLGWLQRLPVDVLKLDRTFVARIDDPSAASSVGADDVAILSAILRLGQALDLTIVAEGIETKGQLALLKELGCDEGQGYLFSKPLPATELRPHLDRGTFPFKGST